MVILVRKLQINITCKKKVSWTLMVIYLSKIAIKMVMLQFNICLVGQGGYLLKIEHKIQKPDLKTLKSICWRYHIPLELPRWPTQNHNYYRYRTSRGGIV